MKQEAKSGITHNNENVPAWVTPVNDKSQIAIRKAAYKCMMTEEEVMKVIYSKT